jgi:hypothetical protein
MQVREGMTAGALVLIFTAAFMLLPAMVLPARAATGCDLNFPDRDVPRLFPESTSYKTKYLGLTENALKIIVSRLGENFRVLYDPLNVPYTVYEIFTGEKKVGYIHGVNHKGQYGGIQVFIALDQEGNIKSFYIQKMTSPSAGKFRDAAFGKLFMGVSLKDFDAFDPVSGKGSGRLAQFVNPAPDSETDFYSILRALKKNLIIMDVLVFSAKEDAP